jgi:CspA family cold shock protein
MRHLIDRIQRGSSPAGANEVRKRGRVKFFNLRTGWGYIVPDDGDDVFVHKAQLKESNLHHLVQNQTVTFIERDGGRGPRAYDLKVIA